MLILDNQNTTLFIHASAYAQNLRATSYIIIQTHRLTLPLVQCHMRLKTVKYHLLSGSYLVIALIKITQVFIASFKTDMQIIFRDATEY